MAKHEIESVYATRSEPLGDALADPLVNWREHQLYWPRFKAMLPLTASRVLDYGCGSGYFTHELAAMYPQAEIVGVDSVEAILPESSEKVAFMRWNGSTPLNVQEPFDLFVAKMSLHYLSDDQLRSLATNLLHVLSSDALVALSVPHPSDSARYNDRKQTEWDRRHSTGSIVREIGATGVAATMYHRNITGWFDWIWPKLKERARYSLVLDDDVSDENGTWKRMNVMFYPLSFHEEPSPYQRIEAIAGPTQEVVFEVDPTSVMGKELLYGDLSNYPKKPLP